MNKIQNIQQAEWHLPLRFYNNDKLKFVFTRNLGDCLQFRMYRKIFPVIAFSRKTTCSG